VNDSTHGNRETARGPVKAGRLADGTDRELLQAYHATRSQDALEAIVHRHTPLVYAACLGVLGDHHAAEDAAQGAFLIFCRKADRLKPEGSLRAWLYATARLTARVARRDRAIAQKHEAAATALGRAGEGDAMTRSEVRIEIHEALDALSGKLREAVVLCHLAGLSEAQAAEELKCPVGTVSSRLARALEKLRTIFARRGTVLSVGAIAAMLGEAGAAEAPAGLAARITATCAGQSAIGTGSWMLVKRVESLLLWKQAKLAAAVAACLILGGAGAGVVWRQAAAQAPARDASQAKDPVPAQAAGAQAPDAAIPPPCGPFAAKEDGAVAPSGAYQSARLTLEKGGVRERAGLDEVQLILGFRDGRATSAWVTQNACPWIRHIDVSLEGGRLRGRIKGGAAEGDIWLEYALDAKVEGDRITGTYTGQVKGQPLKGGLRGELLTDEQMRQANALAPGKDWPSWYGISAGLRGPDCGRAMIEFLSDARPVWKSEEIAGSAYGNAPDDRYGPEFPVASNIGSGASSPVVADGLVYWYFYVPSGPLGNSMFLQSWRETWAKKHKDAPFPSKSSEFFSAASDDVFVAIDGATGKTVWKTTFARRNVNIQTHKHRGFNPTPLVTGGVVYAGNYACCYYALDARTGKALWTYDQVKTGLPVTVGPVMAGEVLVVAGAKVAGLDPKSGRPRWTAAARSQGPLIPWTDGRESLVLILTGTEGRRDTPMPTIVVAMDVATGKERWKAPVKMKHDTWHPLMEGGYLIGWSGISAGGGVAQIAGTLHCYKIKPDGLDLAWEGPGPNPVDDYYAMAIANGVLYVAGFKECWSMELATGKKLGQVQEVGGKSTLYLFYADGRLINSPEGRHGNQGFAMVDARDPARLVKLVSPSMTEQAVVHIKGVWHPLHAETCAYANHPILSPLVDGRLFVRGRDAVYCYDLRAAPK
jgi:RNA polymerase sigma factor (sigma-70 family)